MTSQTYYDVPANAEWEDLTNTYAGLASAPAIIQNKGPGPLLVFFSSSAGAPSNSGGQLILPNTSVNGTAAHIWVKSPGGNSTVSPGLI